MSRKDMIIITVLINLGLLAVLFAVAVVYDDGTTTTAPAEVQKTLAQAYIAPKSTNSETMRAIEIPVASTEQSLDEMDHVLSSYVNGEGHEISVFDDIQEPILLKDEMDDMGSAHLTGDFVEVTIKRGDALEKIARANNTTVSAIMKENNLRSEKLSVGQVLRVPVGKKKASKPSAGAESSDRQYYIVKSGDSPWKIAKQFNVKFEDLLRLNNLDEDKARNLKIGDKLRVK